MAAEGPSTQEASPQTAMMALSVLVTQAASVDVAGLTAEGADHAAAQALVTALLRDVHRDALLLEKKFDRAKLLLRAYMSPRSDQWGPEDTGALGVITGGASQGSVPP